MLLLEPYRAGKDVSLIKMMLAVINDKERNSHLIHSLRLNTPYVVIGVEDSLQAQEITAEIVPDFLLIDYRLSGIDGITLYAHMQMAPTLRNIPTLIINAPSVLERAWSTKRGVACLNETWKFDELFRAIERLEASSHTGSGTPFDTMNVEISRLLKRIHSTLQ